MCINDNVDVCVYINKLSVDVSCITVRMLQCVIVLTTVYLCCTLCCTLLYSTLYCTSVLEYNVLYLRTVHCTYYTLTMFDLINDINDF